MNEVAWSSSPNDEWNLLHLRPVTLRFIYCDRDYWGDAALTPESLKKRRQKHRKLTSKATRQMPRRTEEYRGPEEERERVRERRQKNAPKVGEAAIRFSLNEVDRLRLHQQLDELLDNYELDPGTVDKLGIKKVTAWEMGYKDNDGEAQSHPLYGIQLEADPKKFTPEWPPVTRIESVKLPRRERSEKDRLRTSRRAVVLSDLQIPYQDEKAVQVALNVLRDIKPDKVVLVGDLLDLSAWSKYIQRPEWATATQDAINQAHQLLAMLRKIAPTAEIVVLEGNHDKRMENYALNNAQAAYGLRRADQPEGWPVLSVPYLTAMDNLDIEYISGYPANRYWINQNLQIRHGSVARKGNTAIAVAQEERISTIFGHIHRVETQYLTHHTYEGGKTIGAWSIGCLCDIMGRVPSVKGGVDLSGKPVPNAENWQQGIAIVDYEDGDGAFNVQPTYINTFQGYATIVNGRKYSAD